MTSPATTPMLRDQQFCLRWNNYQSNLIQVFNQLFQTESFVDVTLACEGHSVKAHRMVLSACSPYFQNVLLEAPCSHPVVILQGVKWSELKAIVEFIYKGEININQDQLSSLLRVAESLKIRGLADVGGEEAEAVLTSPSSSPRVSSQFWAEENPRKRRRLSDEHRSRSRSRSRSPRPSSHTPPSAAEVLDSLVDLQGPLSRGSSSASNQPPSLPSLPSPSPVASLANSLSSFAHFHAPMPPPGPPLPPHLAHLPPLSPLSPLLNMHPMPRHHSPEDFEIRPGIAEMIREEERVSSLMSQQNPEKYGYNLAKLLESTHHWMANPMADGEQFIQSLKTQSLKCVPPTSEDGSNSSFLKFKLRNVLGKPKANNVEVLNVSDRISSTAKSKSASKWTQDDLASALLMVKNGTPIKPAAEKFHIPVMTLWRRTRALGLVSSKVQCGFRYSSNRGSCPPLHPDSISPSKVKHENEVTKIVSHENSSSIPFDPTCSSFLKERSPLTESNSQLTCNAEDINSSLKFKNEEKSSKENSPLEVNSSASPSALKSSEPHNDNSKGDSNTVKPPKEFLEWLSCLGNCSPQSLCDMKLCPNSVKEGN